MFIAIPVGMNYRTERYPVVTFTLIGINTVVWLATLIAAVVTEGESSRWVHGHLWFVPGACTWYAPVTAMFVHSGILHLAGNMIYLFLFGACVEDLIGRLRFTIFYLVSGLAADLVYIVMLPGHFQSPIPMGGASGAISGCMGMYVLLRAGEQIEFKYFFWFFLIYMKVGEFELPAWVAIAFYFASNLLFAVLGMFGSHDGGVAFGAHVGGFLAGLGLIAAYKWLAKPRGQAAAPASGRIIDPSALLAASRTSAAPVVAPSTETPTIYLHDGKQQIGPFTLTTVQRMLQQGAVQPDASYWSEGMTDWESVVDLSGQPLG
jgi:membrane associated rhomboid family serine protease